MKVKNKRKNVMDMACPQGPSTGTVLKKTKKVETFFKHEFLKLPPFALTFIH